MPRVSDLLQEKDGPVYTCRPDTGVLDAVRRMNAQRIGALVVTEDNQPVGMFTERDVLRLVGALQDVGHIHVRDVMTRDIVTVAANTDLDDVQELMRSRRIRHLPVVDPNCHLIGLVSIGDINAWCVHHQARQLQGLNEYIHGRC